MSAGLGRVLERAPLPLLLSLPMAAGAVATWLVPTAAGWWLAWTGLVTLVLSAELSRQLTRGTGGVRHWSRELSHAAERTARLERRVLVVEQLAERRQNHTSPSTSKTFRLFTQLVRAEEATRAQMAAELHDAVAQTMSKALIELRTGHAAEALESIEDAEEQLRGVMARMRPPELVGGDLAGAVGDLAADLRRRYGVEVDVSWTDASVPLPLALGTTFYRFVQEALLNAVVHADGVDVRLSVDVVGPELHVTVSDGGPGFAPEAVVSEDGRHVGLKLAKERARLAGGAVELLSAPGQGTRATLRLPLGALPVGELSVA